MCSAIIGVCSVSAQAQKAKNEALPATKPATHTKAATHSKVATPTVPSTPAIASPAPSVVVPSILLDTNHQLNNSIWVLEKCQQDGRLTGVGNTRVFNFTFKDSTFHGVSFCNDLDANFYTYKDGSIKIFRIAFGEKLCSRPIMDSEREFLNDLRQTNRFKLEQGGNKMKLLIDKSVIAVLKRMDQYEDVEAETLDSSKAKQK